MRKPIIKGIIVFLFLFAILATAVAAQPNNNNYSSTKLISTFVYNGDLQIKGKPRTGVYDFKIDLYDQKVGGQLLDSLTINDVSVEKGKYTVDLSYQLEQNINEDCWIQVSVRIGNDFVVVDQRKPVKIVIDGLMKKWLEFIKDLPSNIIGSQHIIDGAVSESDIGDNAVTQTKISAGAVTLDKIGTDGAQTGEVPIFNGDSLNWAYPQENQEGKPLAYAYVNNNGIKISGTANLSVSLLVQGNGMYQVTLDGEVFQPGKHLVFVTPNSPCIPSVLNGEEEDGSFYINFISISGEEVKSDFSVIVYKIENSMSLVKYYRDFDNDGYGVSSDFGMFYIPDGYYRATQGDDFDDRDEDSYPGAPEIPDGKDNNGDGETDEGLTGTIYYRDSDQDGYGFTEYGGSGPERSDFLYLQEPEFPYTALVSGDWADGDPSVHPNAEEVFDGMDNDCDGLVDEGTIILINNAVYDLSTDTTLEIPLINEAGVETINAGFIQLVEEVDYSYEVGKVILTESFMKSQPVGELNLMFGIHFDWGAGSTEPLTIIVIDSSM